MRSVSIKILNILVLFCLYSGLFERQVVKADNSIPLTALGVPYLQNFDTLANTGESSVLPSGWFLAETGTNKNGQYRVNSGSASAGDTYSYGTINSTDRALGGLQDGNLVPRFGASFTNLSGETIESIQIRYFGEEWRLAESGRPDKLYFELSTDATALDNGTWKEYEALTLFTPYQDTTGVRNGNAAANRSEKQYVISGKLIAAGTTFWIRWRDHNASGNDDGLAVDEFSLTPFGRDKAPTITNITPLDNAIKVPLDENITISFSEPVTLANGWLSVDCSISGHHSFVADTGPQNFVINPKLDFVNNDICTISITANNVIDQDLYDPPNELDKDYSFTFSTLPPPDIPPVVTSTSPSNNQVGVLVDARLTVNFSEPVDALTGWFSIDCSSSGNHPAAVEGGPTDFSLVPLSPFLFNESCTLFINAQNISDKDDEDPPFVMPSDFSMNFTTQLTQDSAPYLVSTNPANKAVSVPVDQLIELTFNESVIIGPKGVKVACTSGGPFELTLDGGPTFFQFYPDHDFNFDDDCSVTVSAPSIADLDDNDPPNNMILDQTFNFKTQSDPKTPPSVSFTEPANGAINIALDSNLSVTFNKDIWISEPWVGLKCSISGDHDFFTSGTGNTRQIDPYQDFANDDVCTLTIFALQVHSLGTTDPPDGMIEDYQIVFRTLPLIDLPPTVIETYPANLAVDVPVSGSLKVTFSKPVFLSSGWIDFTCTKSGDHFVALNDGPVTYSFGAESDFSFLEICTITLNADKIYSQITNSPPKFMLNDYSYSFTTQKASDVFSYPTVINDERTFPNDGDYLYESLFQLVVQFSEEVMHDGGNDAADNIQNYCLIRWGANQLFETTSCDLLGGDDEAVPINRIVYDSEKFQATLFVNYEMNLPDGKYRLIVSGDHSIKNLNGIPLNNGVNSIINFTIATAERVVVPTLVIEPNTVLIPPVSANDSGTGNAYSGTPDSKTSTSISLIPVTGFPRGKVTLLSPERTIYADLGDLWIEVPAMDLKTAITGVPKKEGNWDVTWLGNQAGWLEGSAFPSVEGNSVLTAHVWDALNQPGPFYGLEKMQKGDQVIIHNEGKEFVYEVRKVLSVKPGNVNAMLKHQETSWLTLVTCQGYDEDSGEYRNRILVRAALVEVR